jgi:microsomal dipeptidase-like Zn-dependent dipeptidase
MRLSPLLALAALSCALDVTEPAVAPTSAAKCTPLKRTGVWGFADLHTHPASHLAFGEDWEHSGMFFGRPGGAKALTPALAEVDLANDLPACDGAHHDHAPWALSTDLWPAKDAVQDEVFKSMDNSTGSVHLPGGYPEFVGWPSARSLTHQQMHVEWLHRAWRGGMRLLVGSVTDNQVLNTLWHFDPSAELEDQQVDPSWADYDSAVEQLKAIHTLVSLNQDWMVIVRTPDEAVQVITEGKLAVVLAVEMDSLTSDQIVDLAKTQDVRLATPVHLTDNDFGGTAVYSDIFNTAGWWLRGHHLETMAAPELSYRLNAPLVLEELSVATPLGPQFVYQPSPADHPNTCEAGYEVCDAKGTPDKGGHRNARGLYDTAGLLQLWKAGVIVDVSHMSWATAEMTLMIAEAAGVPVTASHTDVEPPAGTPRGGHAPSERTLTRDHAARLGALGGVIGLGTNPDLHPVRVARADGYPLAELNPDGDATWTWAADAPHLRIGLRTGDDGVRESSGVTATVILNGAALPTRPLTEPHGKGIFGSDTGPVETIEDESVDWFTVQLPRGAEAGDIDGLELELVQGVCDGCTSDNWSVEAAEVYFVSRDDARRLYADDNGAALVHRFTENDDDPDTKWDGPTWTVPTTPDDRHVVVFETRTGADDLRCGADVELFVYAGGQVVEDPFGQRLDRRDSLPNGVPWERPMALPPLVDPSMVEQVGLRLHQGACEVGTTGENWNLDHLRVWAPNPAGSTVLVDRTGSPFFRFKEEMSELVLPVDPWPLPATTDVVSRYWRLTVVTGDDDLGDDRGLDLTVRAGGPDPAEWTSDHANAYQGYGNGSSHWFVVDFGHEVSGDAIEEVELHVTGFGDDWKVAGLEIEALAPPLATWWANYRDAFQLLGTGVALGTDLNGFEAQLPFAEEALWGDLPTPPGAPSGFVAVEAPVIGKRDLHLQSDGIATVGMLPDFLAGVGRVADDPADTAPVFASAAAFINQWYRQEHALACP